MLYYFYRINLFISCLLLKNIFGQDIIQISTNYGDIIGRVHNGSKYSDHKFYSFKGIPYANPPVGDLLFKCPETVSPWNEPLQALNEGNECPQIDIFGYTGNNDCLYLNIYSPKIPGNDSSNEYLPVMVFIHGGKYILGSGNDFLYDPSFLIRHNVLIVTLNYRLGAYGFLSLETPEYSGNNGLKDQVLALRWVKENIVYFGGDSNKITLFGESAGASSVHLHLLSPLSQGLFQRAIAQSGSATCDWAIKLNARDMALKLAKKLNCTYSNDNEIINCLKSRTTKEVIEAHGSLAEFDLNVLLEFSPGIEPLGSKDSFITEHPLEIMKQGKVAQVPFISGMNSLEGLLLLNFISSKEQLDTFNTNMSLPIEIVKRYESREEIEALRKKIKDYYFNGKDYDDTDEMTNQMTDFQTDIHFTLCITESIRFHAKYSSELVYAYLFDYEGERNFVKKLVARTDKRGAAHSDDLFYLFNPRFLKHNNISDEDWKTIDTLSKYWTNFAYDGSPDPKWAPVSPEGTNISYLWITSQQENGKNSFMKEDLLPGRIQFWESYFKN